MIVRTGLVGGIVSVMTEPAAASLPAPCTEADLDEFPDNGNRYEIIDGRLIVTPPGTDNHGSIQAELAGALLRERLDRFRVVVECGIRVPDGNLIADVAVLHPFSRRGVTWRDARDVALVIEVASPASAQFDATDKLASYARAGIANYWRVEQNGTTHVYELDGDTYTEIQTVAPGGEWTASAPFEVALQPAEWLPED
jgi:Uma2 family endonuclease